MRSARKHTSAFRISERTVRRFSHTDLHLQTYKVLIGQVLSPADWGRCIKSKAEEEISNTFVASRGWFEKFKKRANSHSIKLIAEAASADVDAAKKFPETLKEIIEREYFSPNSEDSGSSVEDLVNNENDKKKEVTLEKVLITKVLKYCLNDVDNILNVITENDPDVGRSVFVKGTVLNAITPYKQLLNEREKK